MLNGSLRSTLRKKAVRYALARALERGRPIFSLCSFPAFSCGTAVVKVWSSFPAVRASRDAHPVRTGSVMCGVNWVSRTLQGPSSRRWPIRSNAGNRPAERRQGTLWDPGIQHGAGVASPTWPASGVRAGIMASHDDCPGNGTANANARCGASGVLGHLKAAGPSTPQVQTHGGRSHTLQDQNL